MTGKIFLTGASGVVGTALLDQLPAESVLALKHRRAVAGADHVVHGNVSTVRFGLPGDEYRAVVDATGCVVHAAANTQLNAPRTELDRINLLGTRHAIELANDADVRLIFVSTAFVDAIDRPENRGLTLHYAESKRECERLVISKARQWTIVRPSIVIGDSRDGRISEFQGIYRLGELLTKNQLPFIPCTGDAHVDFVTQDVVSRVIAALAAGTSTEGSAPREEWITAGQSAPTVSEVVRLMVTMGREWGMLTRLPRHVDRDQYERLIRPVFLSNLGGETARRIDGLFTHVAPYVSIMQPFPDPTSARSVADEPLDQLRLALKFWNASKSSTGAGNHEGDRAYA